MTEQNSAAFKLEGGLFLHGQLEEVFKQKAAAQEESYYHLDPGCRLKNECDRAFNIARALWKDSFAEFINSDDEDAVSKVTKAFVVNILQRTLEYRHLNSATVSIDEICYPITDRLCLPEDENVSIPLCIASANEDLDEAYEIYVPSGTGSRRKSPFAMTQEYLNASEPDTWAIVSNGKKLRLLRDSFSLTRPSFIEFDLEQILDTGSISDFRQMWLFLHSSRLYKSGEYKTVWDAWVAEGATHGERALDKLREGVSQAVFLLGNGFYTDTANQELCRKISCGELSAEDYYRQILRLIYRFIFVFCLEERDLINIRDDSEENTKARERYSRGYAFARYREICRRRRFHNRSHDAWECASLVLAKLHEGCSLLALPALGGLFSPLQCPDLVGVYLSNEYFYEVMRKLRWVRHGVNAYLPVDYKNMGSEELGSVYESLLEMIPSFSEGRFVLGGLDDVNEEYDIPRKGKKGKKSNKGNDRKSSGSYYTPDCLVNEILKSALEPVIQKKLKEDDPEQSLLSLRIIDPACGSGHFLLGAARMVAERLAFVRSSGEAVTPIDYRKALREVIEHCIYGVDLNPLAVELARMALWLEGYCEGKPLSFLDSHLKCGNSLIGVFDLKILNDGIPSVAYTCRNDSIRVYDDPNYCKELKKENTAELKALRKKKNSAELDLFDVFDKDPALLTISTMPTDSLEQVRRKEQAYAEYCEYDEALQKDKERCDLYMGAFFLEKHKQSVIPLTSDLINSDQKYISEVQKNRLAALRPLCRAVCKRMKIFNWPLEFPLVFKNGGFDCVIGNPPWDKPKVLDKEWFAPRCATIVEITKGVDRKKAISALKDGIWPGNHSADAGSDAAKKLYQEYVNVGFDAKSSAFFCKLSAAEHGRFALTCRGDANLYSYFTELATALINEDGRCGLILPTGIAFDSSTEPYRREIMKDRLISLYDFENRGYDNAKFFEAVDTRFRLCLITLGKSLEPTKCAFYCNGLGGIEDKRKILNLSGSDLELFNPNVISFVASRSVKDLELLRKIYSSVPVLKNESRSSDPWKLEILSMFHMTNDSALFKSTPDQNTVPLYEGKFIHQFDSRFATYTDDGQDDDDTVETTAEQKSDPNYEIRPRYYIDKDEVASRMEDKQWLQQWVFGIRIIASATNERTVIASVLPSSCGVGNSMALLLPNVEDKYAACLLANLNSLVLDYVARQKATGANINLFILKQLPVISADTYTEEDIKFIVARVAALTRNHRELIDGWLTDHPANPGLDEIQRLKLRCELDAYFAKLYGLSRQELEFILDPATVMGEDYPSLTFPGLRDNEIKRYGEYRTARLVLEAYDAILIGELK